MRQLLFISLDEKNRNHAFSVTRRKPNPPSYSANKRKEFASVLLCCNSINPAKPSPSKSVGGRVGEEHGSDLYAIYMQCYY